MLQISFGKSVKLGCQDVRLQFFQVSVAHGTVLQLHDLLQKLIASFPVACQQTSQLFCCSKTIQKHFMKLFLLRRQIFQLHVIFRQFLFLLQHFRSLAKALNQRNGKQRIDGIIKSRFSTGTGFKTNPAVTAICMITVKGLFIARIINFSMLQQADQFSSAFPAVKSAR